MCQNIGKKSVRQLLKGDSGIFACSITILRPIEIALKQKIWSF